MTILRNLILFIAVSGLTSSAFAQDVAGGGRDREKSRQKLQEHMKNLDADGNHSISEAEFIEQAKERFKKLDKDGDGQITPEEFKSARGDMPKTRGSRGGNRRFTDQ